MNGYGKYFSGSLAAGIAVLLTGELGGAQEPLNPPSPLVQPTTEPSQGETTMALEAAARTQNLGLPSIAAGTYRQLLAQPGADRPALTLALATALLDAGRPAEAAEALATLPEPHGAAWHLRAGLAAFQLGKRDVAQAEWDRIKDDELIPGDRAWYYFLAGALWDTAAVQNMTEANKYYLQAETAATTDLAKAQFQLAEERVRLRQAGTRTEADLRTVRDNYDRLKGTQLGYAYAEAYAVALDLLGRKAEAVVFLQAELLRLPVVEKTWWDKLRLDLGLIGDRSRSGAGRLALTQLLVSGNNAERQRQALELLAEASRAEPERALFRADLNRLIGSTARHPILESLLYYRAQLALAEADYGQAEKDANALLAQFPGSLLRAHAYGVLTQAAWEQRRFRLVAENARRARAELPASSGKARADFGVLEAEASFRAADYRNAADAYAAVLRERPPGLEARNLGALMFQRVLAEINAGSPDAAKVLDELETDPAFDIENRWQAEWSLARSLQVQLKTTEAYARVTKLLSDEPSKPSGKVGAPSALKPELRARMAWLQARLSFEAGQFEQTLKLVDALLANPGDIDSELRKEISSRAFLDKAGAEFALSRETTALETLKKLRADFPDADAAIESYLIEAQHYADQDKIGDAQLKLTSLTDNPRYQESKYLPAALFRLALLSEQLGQQKNLQEANRRIEQLVKTAAAAEQPDLIFTARLKQGDLFRNLNDFPSAQRAYEELVNKYPHRPDVVFAQFALAQTHNAQSASDPSHAEIAQLKYEELLDRVDAPTDIRVMAGYNYGLLLIRRGQEQKAAEVWLRDVIDQFIPKDQKPIEAGPEGPYWLARTLLDLGQLLEKQGEIGEAKRMYRLLLEKRLPAEALARTQLERLGVPAADL